MRIDTASLGTTVLPLIDHTVVTSPHHVAVRGPDGTLTYDELSVRAERLAQQLRMLGVKPGDLIGLCLDRSASLVVAALAIFRAGGAYVAIDPRYPDERVSWMLDDSHATAVVTDADTAARLPTSSDRPCVVVADGGTAGDGSVPDSAERLPEPPRSTDIAYVVYTSGSTGRPKGVPVEHASLANLVDWHRGAFALGAGDRSTLIASPGFDAAVWEIWPSLASGAAIHVVSEDLRTDPVGLRDWLLAEGITVTFLPTAVAESVMGLAWPEDAALRYLLTGGDALTRRPPPGLGFTVVNNYGLSETAVVATSGAVAPGGEGVPSIGRPIAGVVAEVVDEHLRPVEPGADGELVIGGVAVGPGYLNRDELTADRFLNGEQGRRYRTGDRARLRPDGELEFLGRLDDQLSIRGFRVEPGEVAAALNSHPAIEASVAIGIGSSSADRQLVAYVVAAADERPQHDELDAYLGGFLPEHLVPSRYIWLDELPLTQHGKIDRDALPAPVEPVCVEPAKRSPGTRVEAAIASVVAELLGVDVDEIGIDQNFFLLGGHSMLGAQLIVRVEDLFGVEIGLRYLFDHPTPATIAAEVERQMAADSVDRMPDLRPRADHARAATQASAGPTAVAGSGQRRAVGPVSTAPGRTPPPERALYLDIEPDAIFAQLHAPAAAPQATAVLIAPPWGWDAVASYRSVRAWAQHLAQAGHMTLRFDFPGWGDSGGAPTDAARLEAWAAAIAAAADWLRAESGCGRIATVGLGLGGLVTGKAIADGAVIDDLVLWAAPARGRAFVREQRAFSKLQTSRLTLTGEPEPSGLPEGWLEAGGFVLTAETIEALEHLDLRTLHLGGLQRALLLERGSQGIDEHLRAQLEAGGVEVTSGPGDGWEAMVFHPERPAPPEGVFARVTSWLAQAPEPATTRRVRPPAAADELVLEVDAARVRESPLTVRWRDLRLAGVLAEPVDTPDAGLCAVFLNAGAVRRTGPNRVWVEAARRSAASGVPALRIDLEGIGDADGDADRYRVGANFYAPELLDQVEGVLDALEARGLGGRFVLAGLCAGGYMAFQAAVRDQRVSTAVLVNAGALVWDDDLVRRREGRKIARVLEPEWRRKILRGDVTIPRMRAIAGGYARDTIRRRLRVRHAPDEPPVETRIHRALDHLRDSGTRLVFAFSGDDPLCAELEADGILAQLEQWPTVELARIPGRDHTFRPIVAQRAVHDLLEHQLALELARTGVPVGGAGGTTRERRA